jgi:hypothetical protein
MIRNEPGNRKHKNNTPYRRVNVPLEILDQLDTLGSFVPDSITAP